MVLKQIKQFIKKTPLYPIILKFQFIYLRKFLPPEMSPSASHNKRLFILQIAKENKTPVFIETGTYLGDTVSALRYSFQEIYSIELDEKLAQRAKNIFKKYKHIHILQGDSAKILPKILEDIKKPTLFWLDAHYSGGITAKGEKENLILDELQTILNWWVGGSVILIDDARLFNKENNWPEIEDIKSLTEKLRPNLKLEVFENLDIIKIY
jgi:hypothetical protein